MKYLYLLFISILYLPAIGQTSLVDLQGHIGGFVYDGTSKETIAYASVRILSKDSTYIQGTATNEKGKFGMKISEGEFLLEVSFVGYKKYYQNFKISQASPFFICDSIYLKETEYMLDAAIVEAKVPDIVVKGDTIEYNAGSYSSQDSDMLQDIISNIPGIEVNADGSITAKGKTVTKILVDGKEFFGNDIAMALHNLPANMIKKLQLYKEASEESKTTGFKDTNPQQVINLVVKDELKQSLFGNVKVGYGSNDKYANKATLNYMRNNNQVSVVGDMNSINDNDYSLMTDNGVDKNKNLGTSTQFELSDKLKLGGSLRYSNNENNMETQTNTQTFLSSGDRLSKQEVLTKSRRNNANISLNMEWRPDSLTTIYTRSYISFNNSLNTSNSSSLSYVAESDTTRGQSMSQSKGNGYSLNNYFTIGRRLNSEGRTVSFSFNGSIRKDDNDGNSYSKTIYSGETENKIIDQQSKTESKINNYNFTLSYVEPLNKERLLQFTYSINNSNSNRDRKVWKKDNQDYYSIIDTSYTRNTKNISVNQNIGLNFQTIKEKYEYTVGISISPSHSRNKIKIGDSIIENVKQNVIDYAPRLNFSYRPNSNASLNIDYTGSMNQPALSQLSADTVIVSALSKYYGNPNLKPSYSNFLYANYQKSNYETNRFLLMSLGFSYMLNNIVNYTITDNQGNSTNTYRNVTGDLNANLNFMYNSPLKNNKFSINNNSFISYYKNIGFSNEDKSITHNTVLNQAITGKFKTNKFETELAASIAYNITQNNLSKAQNRKTTTYNLKYFVLWRLPYDFSIQSRINYSHFSGFGDDFKTSEILWNASIEKKFLKKKKGTLQLQFFDILNDRNNIQRYVSSSYMSDSRTNTINRYFMLSFSYQFNIIKNKGKNNPEPEEVIYDGYY